MLLSYLVMLLYIAVALGRFPRSSNWRDLLVHSRWGGGRGAAACWCTAGGAGGGRLPACRPSALHAMVRVGAGLACPFQAPVPTTHSSAWPPPCRAALGLGGVLIVAAAVLGALGLCSWAGMRSTLIIAEVIPFLALAGGYNYKLRNTRWKETRWKEALLKTVLT